MAGLAGRQEGLAVSRYRVFITPDAWQEMRSLPGHVRQRVKKAINALARDPQPTAAQRLRSPDLNCDLWRLRLDRWRIVYIVVEKEKVVDIIAVRKRPPYRYEDLQDLLKKLK